MMSDGMEGIMGRRSSGWNFCILSSCAPAASLLKKPMQASYNFLWRFTFRSVNVEAPGPRVEPIKQLVSERHPLCIISWIARLGVCFAMAAMG